jgi:hypothetical protein
MRSPKKIATAVTARLLQQLGLQRRRPKGLDLESYVRTRYGETSRLPRSPIQPTG